MKQNGDPENICRNVMNRYLIIYSKYTVNGVNDVKQYKKYKNTNFVQ